MSIEEARSLGLKHFFTGKPCVKGHISARYVCNKYCVECTHNIYLKNAEEVKRKTAKWEAENNNKKRKNQANWRARNMAKVKEINKRYRVNNPDRVREIKARYYTANFDKIQEYNKKYKAKKPEISTTARRNRRAREREAEGFHTAEDIKNLLKTYNNKCAVCFVPVAHKPNHMQRKLHVDHIQPLAREGGNFISNLQPLCQPCNSRKSARLMSEWLGENYEEDIKNKKFYYLKCEAVTPDDQ